ncbi:hypothetical protein, partial [Yoonia sp.]|uniref:hypothetical protein n=1 Tax=Yoonia sp. TaxID=2212373 RepID=UPI0040488AD9
RNRTAPQLKRVRPLSVQTETPEGGVVVRVGGISAQVVSCIWLTQGAESGRMRVRQARMSVMVTA